MSEDKGKSRDDKGSRRAKKRRERREVEGREDPSEDGLIGG
jgi:hypothetical protein